MNASRLIALHATQQIQLQFSCVFMLFQLEVLHQTGRQPCRRCRSRPRSRHRRRRGGAHSVWRKFRPRSYIATKVVTYCGVWTMTARYFPTADAQTDKHTHIANENSYDMTHCRVFGALQE
ncbi:unnamed protein product [Ceratitis capitata]|uniref:(Mediterranean fruit fly) hypothetical protein n=1 Tax=Ceratitis capitata TaxID=7213 RepID=A0A811U828_CERCA|nr:unnamed protein product [Ceratitis capitata]